MDTITLDNFEITPPVDLTTIPEQIGYLHALGLDYGWGPTSVLQWCFEHLHISAGLPWWASIAATAALLRVFLIPLYIKSSDSMARMQAMMPITKPITDRMTAARKSGDQMAMQQAYMEFLQVRKKTGVSMRAQFAPMIVQGIMGYCGFKLLRAAAALPVPGFENGGFLWLTDLTVPDPYLLLPLIMGATVHVLIRMGGESGAGQLQNKTMQNFMLWGMPFIIVATCGWLPGAVVVWFAGGGLLGVVQSRLLQMPSVREWLGIAPLYKPKPHEIDHGLLGSFMPQSSASPSSPQPPPRQRNATYMNTSYQAPNLRTPPGKVIDVRGTTRSESNAVAAKEQPPVEPPKSTGVFDKASTAFQNLKNRAQSVGKLSKQEQEEKAKQLQKQTVREYEKRAKERERREKLRGR